MFDQLSSTGVRLCFFGAVVAMASMIRSPLMAQDGHVDQVAVEQKREAIHVRVVDATGSPIRSAKIVVSFQTAFETADAEYDCSEGFVIAQYPKATILLRIEVGAAGYAPRRFVGGSRLGKEIPEELVFRLSPGTKIGGMVKNEAGKPVAGAKVELMIWSRSAVFYDGGGNGKVFQCGRQFLPVTDQKGHWSYEGVPEDAKVWISISHPDYAGLAGTPSSEEQQAELRQQTAEMVLKDGIRLDGAVHSTTGEVISDAFVELGNGRLARSTTTNQRGRFTLVVVESGMHRLRVGAKGFAPTVEEIDIDKTEQPVRVELDTGFHLKFRVVDGEGQGIRARVWLSKIGKEDIRFDLGELVPSSTDAWGAFDWPNAPHGLLKFEITAPGFEALLVDFSEEERVPEREYVLRPEAGLTGKVVDRTTGEPLDRFLVIPVAAGLGELEISRAFGVVGRGGAFSLPQSRLDDRFTRFHLMVEHAGHRTMITETSYGRLIPPHDILIKMERASPVNGAIVDSGGRPVAEAHLTIGEMSRSLIELPPVTYAMMRADSEGRFKFPAPPTDYSIVVTCNEGFFEKAYPKSEADLGTLRLADWGAVSGRVLDENGLPCADCPFRITPVRRTLARLGQSGRTDALGQFRLDRIPPGAAELRIDLPPEAVGSRARSFSKVVEITAGQEWNEPITIE